MTPKVNIVNPTRKRRYAMGSISESFQPRKIGKNVKGLKIMIRSGSLKTTIPAKPGIDGSSLEYKKHDSAPVDHFEFNFENIPNTEKIRLQNNDFMQQSSNFSTFVQNLPISTTKTDDSKVTNGLCIG